MRLPAECAGNGKAEGLTSSPGGCGRYRIRGHADASGNHFCAGRGTYLCGTRGICAGPPWAWPPGGRGAPHGAGQPPGFKVVRFAGYTIRVPASWPVYRLDRDPSRCVRYDRHAVYLGQPGANQQCPAHLVGRTATISIQAAGSAPGPAPAVAEPGGHRGRDRDPAAGRRVGDPRCPGSGDGCLARGSGRIGHRDLHRGRPRGAVHPAQPAAGGTAASRRAGAGPARARVMTRSTAALLSAPLSAHAPAAPWRVRAPRPRCTHPRAPSRAPAHAQRPAPPPGPQARGRKHQRAARGRAQGRSTGQAPGPPAPGPQAPGPPAPGPPHRARHHGRGQAPGSSAHSPPPRRPARLRQLHDSLAGRDAGVAPGVLGHGGLHRRRGGGLRVPEPDRGLGPRGDRPGLGAHADLRRPAGVLLVVLGPDPAGPRGGPGPGRGPRRHPSGRHPGDGPRHPGLLRHGGLPRAPPVQGRDPGLPGRLDQDAARARLLLRGVLQRLVRGREPRLGATGWTGTLSPSRTRCGSACGTTSATCGACPTCCRAGGGGRAGSSSTRARTGAAVGGYTLDIDSDWVYGAVYR